MEKPIDNGKCDLKLCVSLQQPLQMLNPSSNSHLQPEKKRMKRKSPSTLARDRSRAEAFGKKNFQESNISLPFSGQILPLNDDVVTLVTANGVVGGDESMVPKVLTPPEMLPAVKPVAPVKASSDANKPFIDVFPAKKQLFSSGSSSTIGPNQDQPFDISMCTGPTPAYMKKKQATWSKLFT